MTAPVNDTTALAEKVEAFVEHFGLNHRQAKWKRTTLDEPAGLEMVHHDGDTIFFGDLNHKDPSDAERFDMIIDLANSLPEIAAGLRALAVRASTPPSRRPALTCWEIAVGIVDGANIYAREITPEPVPRYGKEEELIRAITNALLTERSAAPCSPDCDGWQPIETAPKDGTRLWLFYPNAHKDSRQTVGWYDRDASDGDRWMDHYDCLDDQEPTHWMPLPAAPTQTSG